MAEPQTWLKFSADYRIRHPKANIKEISGAWKKYKQDKGIETVHNTNLETVPTGVNDKDVKPIKKERKVALINPKIAIKLSSAHNENKHITKKKLRAPTPIPTKAIQKKTGEVIAIRAIGSRKAITYDCDEFPGVEEVVSAAIRLIDNEFYISKKKSNVTSLWLHKKYQMKASDIDLIDYDFNDFLRQQGVKGVGAREQVYLDIQIVITRNSDGYEFTSLTYNWALGEYQVPSTTDYFQSFKSDGLYTEPDLYEALLPIYTDFDLIDVNVLIEALEERKNCPKKDITDKVAEYILDTYEDYLNFTNGNKYPWLREFFNNTSKKGKWVENINKFWEGDPEEALGLYLGFRAITYVDNALRGKYDTNEYPRYNDFFPGRINYIYDLSITTILADLVNYISEYDEGKKKVTGTTPKNPSGRPIYRPIIPPKPLPPIPKKPAATNVEATRKSPPKFKAKSPPKPKPSPPKQKTPAVSQQKPPPKPKPSPIAKPSPRPINNARRPELVDCNRDMSTDDFVKGVKNRLDRLLEQNRTTEVTLGSEKKTVARIFAFTRNKNYPIEGDEALVEEMKKGIPKANREDETLFSLDTYAVFMKEKKKEGSEEDNYIVRRYYLFVPNGRVIPVQKAVPYAYDLSIEEGENEINEYSDEGMTEILTAFYEEVEFVDFWSYKNAWDYYWTGKCNENTFGKEVKVIKKMVIDALPDKVWVEQLMNDNNGYRDNLPTEDETNQGELVNDYHVLLYLLGAAQGEPQKYRFGTSKDSIVKGNQEFYKNPIESLGIVKTKFKELFSNASRKQMNKPSALTNALRKPGAPTGGFLTRKVIA